MRKWVDKRTSFPCNFDIAFYPARYAKEKFSILPVGDPTQYIPDSEVCLFTAQMQLPQTWAGAPQSGSVTCAGGSQPAQSCLWAVPSESCVPPTSSSSMLRLPSRPAAQLGLRVLHAALRAGCQHAPPVGQ